MQRAKGRNPLHRDYNTKKIKFQEKKEVKICRL